MQHDRTAEFFEKLQEFFPSTKEAYIESVKEYGDVLETVVIEDIFMPPILKLLSENRERQLLESVFGYIEEILNSNDSHLTDVLSVTVLEILGNDKLILETARQYMGPKTIALQGKADEDLGRKQLKF
ncbi:MAG: resolvase [Clostridium sp.]|nr:resolvase [Clostridium sp.]